MFTVIILRAQIIIHRDREHLPKGKQRIVYVFNHEQLLKSPG